MKRLFPKLSVCLLSMITAFAMTGCVEDEVEVKLNANGSGTVTHTITLSKQATMQMLQMEKQMKNQPEGVSIQMDSPFPASNADIKKTVGDSMKITSQSIKTVKGQRTIKFTGTFKSAEKFFSSPYASEKLGLYWKKKGPKAQLCIGSPDDQGQMQMPMDQMFAMAKGLYVKRSITLPAAVSGAKFGKIDQKNRRVTWEVSLRDQAGLKKAKTFFEGPAKGNDSVTVKGKLKFKIPTK